LPGTKRESCVGSVRYEYFNALEDYLLRILHLENSVVLGSWVDKGKKGKGRGLLRSSPPSSLLVKPLAEPCPLCGGVPEVIRVGWGPTTEG
jgi:hypothetical protein